MPWWRPEEGVGAPTAGVTGGCVLPSMGAGKLSRGLRKSIRHSNPPVQEPSLHPQHSFPKWSTI